MIEVDGRKIAGKIVDCLKRRPKPGKLLVVKTVGDDPVSLSFLIRVETMAMKLGIQMLTFFCDENISSISLSTDIMELCRESRVGGVLVPLPLPSTCDHEQILNSISPFKDVGCLGRNTRDVLPPAVSAVRQVLASVSFDLADKDIVVVGSGPLVGRPVYGWLDNFHDSWKSLTILDSKSDLSVLREADLIITGVGRPGLIKPEMLKKGAGVIDFGNSIVEIKLEKEGEEIGDEFEIGTWKRGEYEKMKIRLGDFDSAPLFSGSSDLLFYTPVPGGIGPILIACLFENFYHLTQIQG